MSRAFLFWCILENRKKVPKWKGVAKKRALQKQHSLELRNETAIRSVGRVPQCKNIYVLHNANYKTLKPINQKKESVHHFPFFV